MNLYIEIIIPLFLLSKSKRAEPGVVFRGHQGTKEAVSRSPSVKLKTKMNFRKKHNLRRRENNTWLFIDPVNWKLPLIGVGMTGSLLYDENPYRQQRRRHAFRWLQVNRVNQRQNSIPNVPKQFSMSGGKGCDCDPLSVAHYPIQAIRLKRAFRQKRPEWW